MDPALTAFLRSHQHAVTTREAREAGIPLRELTRGVRAGSLVRVARGAYVSGDELRRRRFEDRYALRSIAVVRARPDEVAASHTSAAAIYGLPTPAGSDERIHVCHRTRTGTTRRHRRVTVHCCPDEDAVTTRDGIAIVTPGVAAIQTALMGSTVAGVSVMDAVRQRELATEEQVREWLDRFGRQPHLTLARRALEMSDGKAQSPKETHLRLILQGLGYVVVAQYAIEEDGRVFAYADFYIPALRVVVEFDGRVKYLRADGQGDDMAVYREKVREDRIRRLNYGVARIVSSDLATPALVDRRVKDAASTVHGPRRAS